MGMSHPIRPRAVSKFSGETVNVSVASQNLCLFPALLLPVHSAFLSHLFARVLGEHIRAAVRAHSENSNVD